MSILVCVPVYNGFESTERCLSALASARVAAPFRTLIINDTSPDLAIIGVDRARELLAAGPLLPHMPDLKVTFSAGLTGYDNVEELNTCIDRADQALYRAKSEGRDRTVIADPPPPQVGATGTQRLAAAH